MEKTKLFLKIGRKTYELYTFEIERGKLIIGNTYERLPFDEWLQLKYTGYVCEIPYTNELSKERFKLQVYKLLKLFSNNNEIKKIVQKELERIKKKGEILNRREILRERGKRR